LSGPLLIVGVAPFSLSLNRWQGNDGFYAQLGLSDGFFILPPSRPELEKVSDKYDWRSISEKTWTRITEPTMIYLGLGWYLLP
jgi:hypothetical protein